MQPDTFNEEISILKSHVKAVSTEETNTLEGKIDALQSSLGGAIQGLSEQIGTLTDELTKSSSKQDDVISHKPVSPDVEASQDDTQIVLNSRLDDLQKLLITNGETLTNMHRDYHNGFANVIANMQKELEEHRKGIKKEVAKSYIAFLAQLYSENFSIISQEQGDKREKRIKGLFEDILEYLNQNGVDEYNSPKDMPYSRRFCKVANKIPTPDAKLHGFVKESRNVGFHIGNEVIVPESIFIYVKSDSAPSDLTDERAKEDKSIFTGNADENNTSAM
jgi:hypothetical protein